MLRNQIDADRPIRAASVEPYENSMRHKHGTIRL